MWKQNYFSFDVFAALEIIVIIDPLFTVKYVCFFFCVCVCVCYGPYGLKEIVTITIINWFFICLTWRHLASLFPKAIAAFKIIVSLVSAYFADQILKNPKLEKNMMT